MYSLPRNAQIWLPGYFRSCLKARNRKPPKRVWVTIADHFEPLRGGASLAEGLGRIAPWRRLWPEIAARHRDSLDGPAVYTFFYPQEEYHPALLEPLAEMAEQSIADVEVHIHHDGEGEKNFVDRISGFIEALYERHRLLRKQDGRIKFGFIHGNWALDNSLPSGRWCGLNNEISLLRAAGCYADFTLPSAPSPAQTRIVNTIYWATDDPSRPKSHDRGAPLLPGGKQTGDLLMIPGPLALNGSSRKYGLVPRLETGELAAGNPVTSQRVRLWLHHAPRIGDDVFLKLFSHGAKEDNCQALLQRDLDAMLRFLKEECIRLRASLRYVSAWAMRNAVLAA